MSTLAVTEAETPVDLRLETSPHLHSRWTTKQVMWFVVAALIPCVISAVLFFGVYQLLVIAVAVGVCIGTEAAMQAMRKKQVTVLDGSAIITGLLLALIVPPNFNLFFTAIGAVVSISIGKQLFGGLGFNIFNPALVGRAFLQAAFPVPMTTWLAPNFAIDGVTTATPLSAMKFDKIFADNTSMFMGNVGGSMGETSALAVLIGGAFLIAFGVANWRIPLSMTVGTLIFGGLFWLIDPAIYPNPIFHLLAGGFMFGALFMATDMVTSPITSKGMWIFGLGIALMMVLIRLFGGLPEGVMYSILFMNGTVPLINKYTRPRIFGEQRA
jgi:H+/Na+-translocating ferredoxin:NAD+ oxidoreductase subunit D